MITSNLRRYLFWQFRDFIRDRGYGYLRVWEDVLYAPNDSAPDPGTIEGEPYWRARALHSIAAEPLVYLRYAAEKSVTYCFAIRSRSLAASIASSSRAGGVL